MFGDMQELLRWVVMSCVFVLVLSVWVMVVIAFRARWRSRTERIERRLEIIAQPDMGEGRVLRLWSDGHEATAIVPVNRHSGFLGRLELMRRQAAIDTPLGVLLTGICTLSMFVGILVWALSQNILVGAAGSSCVLALAWIMLKQRISKLATLFESQLVDALELAARSLRAGHPLPGAFRLISEEISAPVGTIFGEVCQQQGLGVPLDEALRRAADASPSPDLKLFATSVLIQMRSGGSLADMMDRLCSVMRDRMRLTRRVRVLTAQTQFSKRILLTMPLFVFVVLNALNPEYMRPLYVTSQGHTLLLFAASGLVIGAWFMNRLAVVRY